MKSEEKNKVIAEFMGYKFEAKTNRIIFNAKENNYAYYDPDESWDWLMPVVEKIEGMGYNVRIIGNECEIESNNPFSLISYSEPTKIQAVHKAIYQFITQNQ